MKKIQRWFAALLLVATLGGATVAVAVPQTTYAACKEDILTFPAWYKGLLDSKCNIKQPGASKGGITTFIWTIALNIIEFMLQLVGYIAVGFIIAGGYKFMISAGDASGIAAARKTITNAVIGLVLSIFSIAIVNIVAGALQ